MNLAKGAALASLSVFACVTAFAAKESELDHTNSELRPMIERFTADLRSLNRTYPIRYSRTRGARLDQFFAEHQNALEKVGFDSLGRDGQIDYILLKNYLDRERAQLAVEGQQTREMEPLMPFADKIVELEEGRRKMRPVDAKKAAATLVEIVKSIEASRKANSGEAHVKKSVANRAALRLASLRNTLKDWNNFYRGYDPVFTWWVSEPYQEADQAIDQYARFLRERLAGVKAGGPAPRESGNGRRQGNGGAETAGEAKPSEEPAS